MNGLTYPFECPKGTLTLIWPKPNSCSSHLPHPNLFCFRCSLSRKQHHSPSRDSNRNPKPSLTHPVLHHPLTSTSPPSPVTLSISLDSTYFIPLLTLSPRPSHGDYINSLWTSVLWNMAQLPSIFFPQWGGSFQNSHQITYTLSDLDRTKQISSLQRF